MIRQEEVFYIGKISKCRGIRGEVELLFTDDAFDRGESDYLVIEMDGILVPYFWEEYSFKRQDTAIFKFEFVDTDAAARQLVGRRVFYPHRFMPESEADAPLRSWQGLIGFTVSDQTGRVLGTVDSVDDSSQNLLLYLTAADDGSEMILPLHEDLVAGCSVRERTLSLCLPEGLLNINH